MPIDQRQRIEKAGGVWEAGRAMKKHEVTSSFIQAGLGADFDFQVETGDEVDQDEREDSMAMDLGLIDLHRRKATPLREALAAAGVVEGGNTPGLRELMVAFCKAKGYVHISTLRSTNRQQYEHVVRRFIEHAGNVPLAALTRKHLADFGRDYLRLPRSTRKNIRPLAFWDAVKIAEIERLPCVGRLTRDNKLTLLKTLMAHAVNIGERDAPDPWLGYLSTLFDIASDKSNTIVFPMPVNLFQEWAGRHSQQADRPERDETKAS